MCGDFAPYVLSLKLLNNKIHLASGFTDGALAIYNINDGSLVASLQGIDIQSLKQNTFSYFGNLVDHNLF
jgi:hypothetical protein